MVFHGLHDNYLELTVRGEERQFYLHHLLEFDAVRKCMSVITEDDKGRSNSISIREQSVFDVTTFICFEWKFCVNMSRSQCECDCIYGSYIQYMTNDM